MADLSRKIDKMDTATHGIPMTATEFLAREEGLRGELVDGVFYAMAGPSLVHQRVVGHVYRSIADFVDKMGGDCEVIQSPFDVKLFSDEDVYVEPDVMVVCDPAKLTDRFVDGAPDLIIEVTSPSNASNDYIKKLGLYQRAGVSEYWIVDPDRQTVCVYIFGREGDRSFDMRVYTFTEDIPVWIYDGRVTVNLSNTGLQ